MRAAIVSRRAVLVGTLSALIAHHRPNHKGKPTPTPTPSAGYGYTPYGTNYGG
jgi:hypothetical protein